MHLLTPSACAFVQASSKNNSLLAPMIKEDSSLQSPMIKDYHNLLVSHYSPMIKDDHNLLQSLL